MSKKVAELKFEEKDLPEWQQIVISMNFQHKECRAEDIITRLKRFPKSFQKTISREDITNFAKLKGIFVEGKQKNLQATGNANQEINEEQLAKACIQMMKEHNYEKRVALKCLQEGIEMPKKEEPKKDAKKGKIGATGTKQFEETQLIADEGPKVTEKDYDKRFNQVFILTDYPSNLDELNLLKEQGGQMDSMIKVTEKLVGDYDNVMDEKIEETDEEEDEEELAIIKKIQQKVSLSDIDAYFIKTNKDYLQTVLDERDSGSNHYQELIILERQLEIDFTQEQESIDSYAEYIIEEICVLSVDREAFYDWRKTKTIHGLNDKYTAILNNQHQGFNQQLASKQKQIDKLKLEIEQETTKKKGKVKENEFDEQNKQISVLQQEIISLTTAHKKKEEEEGQSQLKMYNRQMEKLEQEQQKVSVILTCLLDDIDYKHKPSDDQVLDDLSLKIIQQENQQVQTILDQFTLDCSQPSTNTSQEMPTQEIDVRFMEYMDLQGRQNNWRKNQSLMNGDTLQQRETLLKSSVRHLGINRLGMPKKSEKSKTQREKQDSEYMGFVNTSDKSKEVRRLLDIVRFNRESESNQIDVKQVTGIQKMDKDKLAMYLHSISYLDDQTIQTFYDDRHDRLGILIGEKINLDRQLIKHWNYNYRCMPSYESYQQHFINSSLNNDKFDHYYSLSNDKYGRMQEKQKQLFPAANAVIKHISTNIGGYLTSILKVTHDTLHFGIKPNKLWLNINEDAYRILVTHKPDTSFDINIQMKTGIDLQITNEQVFMKNVKCLNELNRRVTHKGSVIRYLSNQDREILFANGNTSYYSSISQQWTSTNNKGLRRSKDKQSYLKELDQIQSLRRTDSANNKILIREDQVVVIHFTNGDRFVQHHDGTQMLTVSNTVVISSDYYLTVQIQQSSMKVLINHAVHVLLQDNKSYLFFEDGLLLVDKPNQMQRILINSSFLHFYDQLQCTSLSQYHDHQLEYISDLDRKQNIYDIDTQQVNVLYNDQLDNQFFMDIDGKILKLIANVEEEEQEKDKDVQGTFEFQDNETVLNTIYDGQQPEGPLKNYQMLYVNNDNTAVRYLSSDLYKSEMFKTAHYPHNMIMTGENLDEYYQSSNLHLFIQKYDWDLQKQQAINIQVPQNIGIYQNNVVMDLPVHDNHHYFYENLIKFQPLEEQSLEEFNNLLNKHDDFQQQNQLVEEQGQYLKRTKEERQEAVETYCKIYKARREQKQKEKYSDIKEKGQALLKEHLDKISQDKQCIKKKKSVIQEQVEDKDLKLKMEQEIWENKRRNREATLEKLQIASNLSMIQKGFVSHYFETKQGYKDYQELCKSHDLEYKCPEKQEEEVGEKALKELGQNSIQETEQQLEMEEQEQQPDDMLMDGNRNSLQMKSREQIKKVSIFQEMDTNLRKSEDTAIRQAKEYHDKKSHKLNLIGNPREEKQRKKVPILVKHKLQSQMNEKNILTESVVEKRVKTSSLANRVFNKATTVNEMRNQGQHQTMLMTEDKKYNHNELLEKRNLMIQNEIGDKLKRDLYILPSKLRFGQLRLGGKYLTRIIIKNEDILQQRISIKQPKLDTIKARLANPGPIAMGLSKDLEVTFMPNIVGYIRDEIQIISKNQIYTIPIFAEVLNQENYQTLLDKYTQEPAEGNQSNANPLLKPNIIDLTHNDRNIDVHNQNYNQNESIISDKLPKINNYSQNAKLNPFDQDHKDQL